MEQKTNFSMEDAAKLLASPEGRQLLALLRRDGGEAMQQAFAAMQAGDAGRARAIMEPLLSDPETAALLNRINRRR